MLCIAKRTGRWPRISPCTRRLERVGRLAVSSRPPPLSFAQVEHLGLPRQRPAGRGTLEGTVLRVHFVTRAYRRRCGVPPYPFAHAARSMPHVKKNVRSTIDSAAVLLGQSVA
jgi:hypothetical protein